MYRWLEIRKQALLCAALLIACVLLVHPYAETGLHDDWSYIRSAQVLAQTGHIVFNGWATAMLGWQLLPGMLAIKIFGFSFTVVRLTTLLVAAPMTILIHRCMVRCGVREWNATIGTLLLMLSPMMIPAVTIYISDIWGWVPIVLSLYCLLRALQTDNDRAKIAWIYVAVLGGAFTGTARQTGFLSVFVMVPCALWLLRHRSRVFWAGLVACVLGDVFALEAVRWFARQPYSVGRPIHLSGAFRHDPSILVRPLLEIPMLLCPVLVFFLPTLWQASRKVQAWFLGSCLALLVIAFYFHHNDQLGHWLVPFITQHGSIFSKNGSFVMWPINGFQPQVIPEPIRLFFTAMTFVGLLAWGISFSNRRQYSLPTSEIAPISWRSLLILTVPFCVVYAILLIPSLLSNQLIDRYVIPLEVFAMLYLLRYYQERVRLLLSWFLFPFALLIAAYSVAATHDSFAMYRAVKIATDEVTSAGVPRDHIDGGWEYNGWTQITEGGYVRQTGVRVPGGVVDPPTDKTRACYLVISFWLPQIQPDYTLSFDPTACGGDAGFRPVVIDRWLSPRRLTVYVVKDPPGNAKMPDYDNIQ